MGQTQIGSNVVSYQANGHGVAAALESDGVLNYFDAAGKHYEDRDVVKYALGNDNTVYDLNSGGTLAVNGTPGWGNTRDFALDATGTLYWLGTGGLLQKQVAGGWQDIGVGMVKFGFRSDGSVFSLGSDGWLYQDGQRGWANTRDFAISPGGQVYWLGNDASNHLLQKQVPGGWQDVASGVVKFGFRSDGSVFSLGSDGWLYQDGQRGWANTRDFAIGPSGQVYWLGTGGLLQKQVPGGWLNLDTGVRSFAVAADGTLYVLEGGGNLYRHTAASITDRQLWYSGVSSFSLAADGVTLNVALAWQRLSLPQDAPNLRAGLLIDLSSTPALWDPLQWAAHAPRPADVRQELAGVCTIDSALASAAAQGLDLAGRMRYLGNSVYRVSLWTGDQDVYFDGKVYATDAAPVIERVTDTVAGQTVTHDRVTSFWALLYQRAYLQSHGVTDWATDDYRTWEGITWPIVGRPSWTSPKNAIAALVGRRDLNNWDADDAGDDPLTNLRDQLAHGAIVTVETKNATDVPLGSNTYGATNSGNHECAVLGVDASGSVHLYNPWGLTPSDTGYAYWKGDFSISWAEFTAHFHTFTTGQF
jgi:hypothetical protein